MKYSKISFIIVVFSVLLFSCRNDKVDQEFIEIINEPTIFQETQVTGLVLDENNSPMEGVEVTINNIKSHTDERGVFLFRKAEISSSGTMVKFNKTAYFQNFRTLYLPKPADKLFVEINMTPMGNSSNFNASTGGDIMLEQGGKIVFQANSIVREYNSQEYNGVVNVFAHWYDPSSDNLGITGPASLIAKDKDGEEKGLYTYGMMAIELQDEFGAELNVKSGYTASLTFPIPSELMSEAPETIPLWYVDEETGIWREEGVAIKVGNEYVGEVGHFSFWNCDVPYDLIDIEGYLTRTDGSPIANYPIFIRRGNLLGGYGYTNNVGYFSGKIPVDELLRLEVRHCGVILVDQEIGPFNDVTDLGTFEVELTDFSTLVTGTMVGCMGEPLTDAYGIIYPNRIITPALDGTFSSIEVGCGAVTLEAQFFHGASLNQTDIIPIDKDADFNNLGSISICDDIQEYISFSIEGSPYRVIPDPVIAIINGAGFVLKGETVGNELRWNMRVPTLDLGTTNPSDVYAYSKIDDNGTNDDSSLNCNLINSTGSEVFLCDNFEVNIEDVNMTENYIIGTFSGDLATREENGGNTTIVKFVEGSFRSLITKNFNECSISGQVWFDLNNDGVRDMNEEDKYPTYSNFSLERLDEELEFGNTYFSSTDGNYSFTGLEPGDYLIKSFAYPYEATLYQVGDPEKDNDFQNSTSANQVEANVSLVDGEDLGTIDAGYKAPNEVFCYINSYNCNPEIELQYNIGGGLPPYTLSLSNGYSEVTSEPYGFINIGIGGDYTMTVVDDLGNSCTTTQFVPEYRNSVGGWVWSDVAGGQENLYDDGIDNKLEDISVRLYKSDGTFVKDTVSKAIQFNGYVFEFLPYGDYYIETDLPTGFTFADVTDVYNGNSIDGSTMRSEVFSIEECNTYVRKNIGFK